MFQRASEAEQVTRGLVDQLAAYLRRAQLNPELRFEPAE